MILELLAGSVLGFGAALAYFGGLWWTVKRLRSSTRPALLFAGSFAVRTLAFVVFAALLGSWSLPALVAAPVGFWVARRVAVQGSLEATA